MIEIILPRPFKKGQIEERLAKLSCIAALRNEESQVLTELRDTLLPKLMSGEIRVRDAKKAVEDAA